MSQSFRGRREIFDLWSRNEIKSTDQTKNESPFINGPLYEIWPEYEIVLLKIDKILRIYNLRITLSPFSFTHQIRYGVQIKLLQAWAFSNVLKLAQDETFKFFLELCLGLCTTKLSTYLYFMVDAVYFDDKAAIPHFCFQSCLNCTVTVTNEGCIS